MSVLIISGSNLPDNTNVVIGDMIDSEGKNCSLNIDMNEVSSGAKEVYSNFFELVGIYSKLEILNSPYNYNVSHVTPEEVINDIKSIDYSILNQGDKDVIDNAFEMLSNFKNDSGIIS